MFSKFHKFFLDALHAYFGLCGLSLMGEPDLAIMEPALNISKRAFNHLMDIHKNWSSGLSTGLADQLKEIIIPFRDSIKIF